MRDFDMSTMSKDSVPATSGILPSLPYTLHTRKTAIAITWSVILTVNWILPMVLFYSLHFHTTLDETIIFAVVSASSGVFTVLDLTQRSYKLLRRSDDSRPLGSGRWVVDFFHWNYLGSFIIIALMFSLGCAFTLISLISLPVPYLMTTLGLQLVIVTLGSRTTTLHTPFRVSSLPRGVPIRPPLYTIIEDTVAVNGGGGKIYRQALDDRYKASPIFQQLLMELSLFWGIGAVAIGVVLIVLIATIDGVVAYGLAWSVPWLWAICCVPITVRWVRKRLVDEKLQYSAA